MKKTYVEPKVELVSIDKYAKVFFEASGATPQSAGSFAASAFQGSAW